MASFSDSFPVDGEPGAGWTEVAGDCDVVSGELLCRSDGFTADACVRTGTVLAADQYLKVTIAQVTAGSNFPLLIFRYADSSSPFYTIGSTSLSGDQWQASRYADLATLVAGEGDDIGTPIDMGGADGTGTIGITVSGSGTDVVFRFWNNPVADTPTSLTSWDGGSDPADQSITADPASPVDHAGSVGVGNFSNVTDGVSFDNVFGGDFEGEDEAPFAASHAQTIPQGRRRSAQPSVVSNTALTNGLLTSPPPFFVTLDAKRI